MSEYLAKYYFGNDCGAKVYMLIDEYDVPLQHAFTRKKPYHDDLIEFMKTLV